MAIKKTTLFEDVTNDIIYPETSADQVIYGDTTIDEVLAEIENTYAPIESPEFTGTPTTPTPDIADQSEQIANTEYVRAAIDEYAGGGSTVAPIYVDTSSFGSSTVDINVLDVVFAGVYPLANEIRTLVITKDNGNTNNVRLSISGFWGYPKFGMDTSTIMPVPDAMYDALVYTFSSLNRPGFTPSLLIKAEYYRR